MLTLKEDTMLGDVPDDWDVMPLKTLLAGNYPGDWGDDRGPHMVRVIRSTNLTNDGRLDLSDVESRALNPEKAAILAPRQNDIFLERSGGGPDQPVGRVGFVEADMPGHAFSNFLHLLRPNEEAIHHRFLGWVLYRINRTGRILRLEQQTTQMRNLNFRDYLTIPLPVPTPDEQVAIAHILDVVDTTIERARTAMRRAIEVKRALVQRLFSEGLRGDSVKKTPIGFVPRSWRVVPVKAVVTALQYGLSVPMQTTGAMPILRMGNIQRGDVLLDDLKYVSLPDNLLSPYAVRRGDVLFNRTNSQELVGKVGIYRHDKPSVFASYLIRLHPDTSLIDPYFLGHLLNSHPTQSRIKRYATPGVQQVNINAKNLGKTLIPVPGAEDGLNEQREIAAILEAADARIHAHQPVLVAQQTLKKSLMHDLLTGRMRVNGVKLEAAEAT